MNKISRYMQNYILYGFPLVIFLMIWSAWSAYFSPHTVIGDRHIIVKILHEILSYHFMCWFLTLMLYMVFLAAVPSVRGKTLRRLANLKERDEREEYITGKAARASYIASLSLALCLLFFSLIDIHLSKSSQIDPHQHGHTVSLNVHYSFFAKSDMANFSQSPANTIFDLSEFSLSSSTLILIFLVWQVAIFNMVARRESMQD